MSAKNHTTEKFATQEPHQKQEPAPQRNNEDEGSDTETTKTSTVTGSTWMYVFGILFGILYILFVTYLCVWCIRRGQTSLALITLISAVNLPVLGPVLVWIMLVAGAIPDGKPV